MWLVCISGACKSREMHSQDRQHLSATKCCSMVVVWLVCTGGASGRRAGGASLQELASCSSCGVAVMPCRSLEKASDPGRNRSHFAAQFSKLQQL